MREETFFGFRSWGGMTASMHRRILFVLAILVGLAAPTAAQEVMWEPYTHPDYGYAIDLPLGLMEPQGEAEGRLIFAEPDGPAQLVLYSEANSEGRSLGEIAESVERSSGIEDVTYRKSGDSWFVMSGYFQLEDQPTEELIFYLKIMVSADRSRYAVFALNYPRADKERFDPVVDRLEASFRPPG